MVWILDISIVALLITTLSRLFKCCPRCHHQARPRCLLFYIIVYIYCLIFTCALICFCKNAKPRVSNIDKWTTIIIAFQVLVLPNSQNRQSLLEFYIDLCWKKHFKIFSQIERPYTEIYLMYHSYLDIYKVCSNHEPSYKVSLTV